MNRKGDPKVQITTHNQSGGTNIGVQNNYYAPPPRTISLERAASTVKALSHQPQRAVQINVSSEDNAEANNLANQLLILFERAGWKVERGVWYGHGCTRYGTDIVVAAPAQPPQSIIAVGQALTQTGLNVFICQGVIENDDVKLIVLGR